MNPVLSHVARLILDGFDHYFEQFDAITGRAQERFMRREWHEARADANERLDLYRTVVTETMAQVDAVLGDQLHDRETWVRMRKAFDELLEGHPNRRLAETWFNSMTRRVWHTVGVDPLIEFVGEPDPAAPAAPLGGVIEGSGTLTSVVEASLTVLAPPDAWVDFGGDVARAAERIATLLPDAAGGSRFELIGAPFFRGRACYLVGRMVRERGFHPLIFSIRNRPGGLVVDAIIADEDRVSILFSFTRAYFHVRICDPASLVEFLSTLMPRKRVAELYISIGFNKHGKTELYRDLLRHLASTDQLFRVAPGQPGLVMAVFGMEGYDIVFKIIKDTFPPPKRTTRNQIRDKYRLVFEHDRAGRLVEAHEFEHLSLSKTRFQSELLEVLLDEAARTVRVNGDRVIIDHAYLERKVTPLDLYVRERDHAAAVAAILDYGDAIRDLMASDIFPGDMLLKNFGVTRHGRVVFYDYDELTRMRDCVFREIPTAPTIEDEMSDIPWFSVTDRDVFPEEFPRFMGLPADVRTVFNDVHGTLFDHRTWLDYQARILGGEIIEIFPYPASYRFTP